MISFTIQEFISDDTCNIKYSGLKVSAVPIFHAPLETVIFDHHMLQVEGVGDLYTTRLTKAKHRKSNQSERGDNLADMDASHHIVNNDQTLEDERSRRRALGDPIKFPNPIKLPCKILSNLWGACQTFRANNISKSVMAVVSLTEELPLLFE